MGLYCSTCQSEVPEGFSQCIACKSGFTAQLACSQCRQLVPRGHTLCMNCQRAGRQVNAQQVSGAELVRSFAAPPALPVLPPVIPGALRIPEEYSAGKLGVSATVSIPPAHAEIMNELSQLATLLHAMAGKLVMLPGDGARRLARGMRTLATDIQEEIEIRVGPQS